LFAKLTALSAGRKMAKQNAPTVHKGVDSVASTVSGHVPEKHRSKVGKGASMIKKALTGSSGPESTDASDPRPAR
jgi:hypothetical protein